MKSAYGRGWEKAAKHYDGKPPLTKLVRCKPPAGLNEIERDSYRDGYQDWCLGLWVDSSKQKRDKP